MTLALRKAEDEALDAAAPAAAAEPAPLLQVRNLTLKRGAHVVLDNVCLDLARADTLALVGESGAGKSTLAYALIGLLRPPEVTITGAIHFDGTDLTTLREKEWQPLRGNRIGLVFQDATAALNPCFTVGAQIAEPLKRHIGLSSRDARRRAIELLESVGIADPERRLSAYAAARDDRDRARVRTRAPARGRTDERSRRHDTSADHGADPCTRA
jgi:peptide/nickel transport system ATP-binding protein